MGVINFLRNMFTTAFAVLLLFALPFAIYIIGVIVAIASVLYLGYFLVTQYFSHKSDQTK